MIAWHTPQFQPVIVLDSGDYLYDFDTIFDMMFLRYMVPDFYYDDG